MADSEQGSNSLSGLVSTLVPVLVLSTVYICAFLILRRSHRRYYAPRTYLGNLRESERTPPLPSGLFNWFGAFWRIPDVHALQHQSLDAYLYLRYLRMCTLLCFVGCCMTWPILFPINATGGGGQEQLDMLTYGNIDRETKSSRYYAHALVCWAFYGFIMYLITRECIFYINLRQAFLTSPLYSRRISSRTVLFTSVPAPYMDEARLKKLFGETVRNVWITHDPSQVDDLVSDRDKTAMRLEKAEVSLIKLANKARQAALQKGGASFEEPMVMEPGDFESGSVAARWVPSKKRPTHRIGLLGLVGKKVDTIDWCREELGRLIPDVEAAQAKYHAGAYDTAPGVFIEFRSQSDAESAAQVLTHHQGLHMTPRYIGIRPDEIIWSSLAIPWWQKVVRRYVVNGFIAVMIIFWAIPVGVISIISNVDTLRTISFLTWLDRVPQVIMGVITGLLPAVALAILMSLVPVIMRLCARLAGEPSVSRVELFTQNAYFVFQVVQVFLVVAVGSSATAVAKKIYDNPNSATTLLAENLPKSNNVYISYMIVQGLTIASGVISQVVGFVLFNLLYKLLAGTPRAMYNKWATLSAISWGSTMPVFTNILVIAIVYSGIAPLVLGWATIGMSLFYLAYRYNVLFVTDTQVDTRGLIYPRALKQLFTGVYLGELVMIGLFGASTAIGPLVLMVIFLVFTILYHASLNSALNPLLYNLPLTLLAEEESRQLDGKGAATSDAHATEGDDVEKADRYAHGASKTCNEQTTASGGNLLTRFLMPWRFSDHNTLRALVPHVIISDYDQETERNAFYPPSVTSRAPLLWIPSDSAGVSKQEVAHTSQVIPITDEGCQLDDNGKLFWDREATRPPIWEEKILY